MFSQYIHSIYSAFLLFPILALVFTLPYLLYQYRKYGSVVIFRAAVVYSFILYLLCTYFLVILPLPSLEEAAAGTGPIWQLHPLQFCRDILAIDGFSPRDLGTYGILLHNVDFWHTILNMVILVPLGVYLRYYFKRGWFTTVLIGFALSLFFEFTQLSALYGIYPRPYRVFDVDDLLCNTFGALCGFIIAPLFTWVFPKREKLDEISYTRGESISPLRRLIAAAVDWLIIFALLWLLGNIIKSPEAAGFTPGNIILYVLLVALYFIGGTYVLGGATVGKKIVKLQITDEKGGRAGLGQYAIRYGLLYYLCLPSLYVAIKLNELSYTVHYSWAVTILVGVFALVFFIFFFQALSTFFKKDRVMLHERFSHTRCQSLIMRDYDREI